MNHEHGYSYPMGKQEITDYLKARLTPDALILDVGPGEGTYRNYLGTSYTWEAVEIWHPTVEFLTGKYNTIYEQDIRSFNYTKDYDLIIFGDILEHLSISDAQEVLRTAQEHSRVIMVAVPYTLPQPPLHGNEAERHLQPDLTPALMTERYPSLELILMVGNPQKPLYGYYYWAYNPALGTA